MIGRAIDGTECALDLVGVTDLDRDRALHLRSLLERKPEVVGLPELVELSDLVVEAASSQAVLEILPEAIRKGKDLVVLSVGGLVGADEWIARAADRGVKIYCPSGAIAGLDGVKAATVGKIERAEITTRKPPAGLAGAPYLTEHAIDVGRLSGPRTIFEGTAREACQAFPANINVAAALSLAGIGVDRTHVRIVADPGVSRNVHEVEVVGDAGRLYTITENLPSENPRTSRLAAYSAIALLESLASPLRIGT